MVPVTQTDSTHQYKSKYCKSIHSQKILLPYHTKEKWNLEHNFLTPAYFWNSPGWRVES